MDDCDRGEFWGNVLISVLMGLAVMAWVVYAIGVLGYVD